MALDPRSISREWGHQRIQSLTAFERKQEEKTKKTRVPSARTPVRRVRFKATKGTRYHSTRKKYYVELKHKYGQWTRVEKSIRTESGALRTAQKMRTIYPQHSFRIVFAVEITVRSLKKGGSLR